MKRLFGSNARADMAPLVSGRDSDEVRSEKKGQERAGVSVLVSQLPHVVEGLAAILAGFVFSAFLTWPLALELGDHIFGLGGDSTGTMAGLRQWANETGYSVIGTSHVASAGAPFGYDQGNGVNLQSAFVFFPAYLITKVAGEIVAYNVVVLSGLALSGAAMYWLVRWLGCAPLVAAWAGLVFIVFPWHLEKAQGHSSLAHLEGFPLLLLAVLAWYRKPDLFRALLIAAAGAVLWTTSGYFGFMGLAALVPLFMLAVIFHARNVGLKHALRRITPPVAASLAVPGIVYAIASRGATEEGIAPARQLQELVFYGARPWEYLIPSYRNRLFGDDVGQWLVAHLHGSNFSETSLYVGWITIVLAACWLSWALVKRSGLRTELHFATFALAATVVTGLVFSLPTPLPRTDIPTPVRLIWEVAPQFRVPARFVALVMAGLVPLAALALDGVRLAIWKHLQPRALAGGAAGGLCVGAMLLSFLELSISPPAIVTDFSVTPPEYAAVRRGAPGILAEYPLAPAGHPLNSDYLFWQRAHRRRILNGARLGTFADAAGQALVDPTAPGTPGALASLGVSVIIVRPPAALSELRKRYRHLGTTATGTTVWQVTEAPAPAIALFATGFYPPETLTPGSTMRWMGSAGRVELYATKAGNYEVAFTVYSYGRARRLRFHGRNGSHDVWSTPVFKKVSSPISLPRGRSSLVLTVQPGPERLPDGRLATVYISNWRLQRVRLIDRQGGRLAPLPPALP
jgi:hypothetical protein